MKKTIKHLASAMAVAVFLVIAFASGADEGEKSSGADEGEKSSGADEGEKPSGPDACDCVEQFNYWSQDGGMYKLDQDLLQECVVHFSDRHKDIFPEDFDAAEKNVRNKCDN